MEGSPLIVLPTQNPSIEEAHRGGKGSGGKGSGFQDGRIQDFFSEKG